MFILSIIGIVLFASAIYWFIEWFNSYSERKENYRFFSAEHTMAYVSGYLMIVFGKNMIESNWQDDPLNGGIILAIGIMIILLTVFNNFKKTGRSLAIKGSVAQLILYIPITLAAFLIIVAAIAYFSQTKPVYDISHRD